MTDRKPVFGQIGGPFKLRGKMVTMSIAIPKLKGSNVFIRTVTHYFTGHVERVTKSWIILSQAAWIADTGRFSEALKTGRLNEVEPYPDDGVVRVARDGVIDAAPWKHSLPREMK